MQSATECGQTVVFLPTTLAANQMNFQVKQISLYQKTKQKCIPFCWFPLRHTNDCLKIPKATDWLFQ